MVPVPSVYIYMSTYSLILFVTRGKEDMLSSLFDDIIVQQIRGKNRNIQLLCEVCAVS